MIEIKVNTVQNGNKKSVINIESHAKHSGSYGAFVAEMRAVFGALEKTDEGVFRDALNDYLLDRVIDTLKESDESEGEDE